MISIGKIGIHENNVNVLYFHGTPHAVQAYSCPMSRETIESFDTLYDHEKEMLSVAVMVAPEAFK